MPLVNAFLKQQQQQNPGIDYNVDPVTGLPYGQVPQEIPQPGNLASGNVMGVPMPLLLVGGAAAIYFFTRKKRA